MSRVIALPTVWRTTVVEKLAYIADHDTGDEDPAAPTTWTISQTARPLVDAPSSGYVERTT
jgi:hypothetical protein